MQKIQRDITLDLLKGFAIFLVVWGHTIQFLGEGMGVLQHPVGQFIYMVHMPLFMFVSGYVSKRFIKKTGGGKLLIYNKLSGLLFPMVIWCLILYIIINLGLKANPPVSLYTFIKGLAAKIIYSYWFIWTLVICLVYTKICHSYLHFPWIVIVLLYCVILILMPGTWCCSYVHKFKIMFPFFVIGYLCNNSELLFKKGIRKSQTDIKTKNQIWLIWLLSGLILYILLWTICKSDYFLYKLSFNFINVEKSELLLNIQGYFFILSAGFSGITFMLAVSDLITRNFKIPRPFISLGQLTLSIYLIQTVIFAVIDESLNIQIKNSFGYFLTAILITTICYVVAKILKIEKWSYLLIRQ